MDELLRNLQQHFNIAFLGKTAQDLGKVLASEKSLAILEALSRYPDTTGMTASELSEALDVARTTVIYHLGRLQESGLVELNPLLPGWDAFWDDYRSGRSGISKEEFNRLHGAKMKGEKLYVPARKGVLILPTADSIEGEAMLREAVARATAPSYKGLPKKVTAAGILAIFLLGVSVSYFPGLPFSPHEAVPASVMDGSGGLTVQEAAPEAALMAEADMYETGTDSMTKGAQPPPTQAIQEEKNLTETEPPRVVVGCG